jgi:transcriptional regulator with XRE-family HTH domain
MSTGTIIKELRQKAGISQKDLADRLGYSQTHFSQVENGNSFASRSLLDRISYELKIPVEVVMFKALTRESVVPEKRELFDQLKPTIDGLIDTLFTVKSVE